MCWAKFNLSLKNVFFFRYIYIYIYIKAYNKISEEDLSISFDSYVRYN